MKAADKVLPHPEAQLVWRCVQRLGSTAALAAKLGVSPRVVQQWLYGRPAYVTDVRMGRWAVTPRRIHREALEKILKARSIAADARRLAASIRHNTE